MAAIAATKYSAKLAGSRVLVLGGTSGIGFCVAEAALEFGARVFVSSSKQDRVNSAVERLKASYPSRVDAVSGHVCDLANKATQEANLTSLFETATQGGQKLDHIAFTAGDRAAFPKTPELTADAVQALEAVRFVGAALMCKIAPKYLNPGPKSSITLTGGGLASKPSPGLGAIVSALSSAMEGLVRGLAVEYKPLRINCVAPGAVATDHLWTYDETARAAALEAFKKMTILDEVGKPEDVAEAYIYAMKDNFLTGTVLNTNGGLMLVG